MRLEFLPAATDDLLAIDDYLAAIDPDLAIRFAADLTRTTASIIERPLTFSPRDALRPGLRAAKQRPYTIYFLPSADLIAVVRILHQSRDLAGLFDF